MVSSASSECTTPLQRLWKWVAILLLVVFGGSYLYHPLQESRQAAEFSVLKSRLYRVMFIAHQYEKIRGESVFEQSRRLDESWPSLLWRFVEENEGDPSAAVPMHTPGEFLALERHSFWFLPRSHPEKTTLTPFRALRGHSAAEETTWIIAYLPDYQVEWRIQETLSEKTAEEFLAETGAKQMMYVNEWGNSYVLKPYSTSHKLK